MAPSRLLTGIPTNGVFELLVRDDFRKWRSILVLAVTAGSVALGSSSRWVGVWWRFRLRVIRNRKAARRALCYCADLGLWLGR